VIAVAAGAAASTFAGVANEPTATAADPCRMSRRENLGFLMVAVSFSIRFR